ncbi:MAG TPA: YggS family pyridoxal phosphate-dependent enzyme [Bacilli bacterium]|jgi:hypothetical protein|nr:YggS family pyridoxal phosphate-dependent enzyme [Bacilli bacterium]HQO94009.1 YggS family pyridoxal phosphate-dependent enzyme [Bacilli bacterium]HQQ39573.1 YggS family pyridoxal phosphate-dependent enzyme [Bacilli bacterium]
MGFKEKTLELAEILKDYPNCKVVIATKLFTPEQVEELYNLGYRDFGENRVEMFLEKYHHLENYKDIRWHFFGNLQTRKVREIASHLHCLHSLDSETTAYELDKRLNKELDCYVQVNISEEKNKCGVPYLQVKNFIRRIANYPKIRIIGLMCIGTMTPNEDILEDEFSRMKELQEEIQDLGLAYAPCTELSMGMSNDFKIALKEGATCIRLGRYFLR